MQKKFNYTNDEVESIFDGINDMFALEGLSESEEEDLDDYDPESDYDGDIDEDDDDDDDIAEDEDDDYDDVESDSEDDDDDDDGDYDSDIDGDSDPAEDEDDDYDDVVENVGISNMNEFLTADEMAAEDDMMLEITEAAIEASFGIDTDATKMPNDIASHDKNESVRIKDFVSVLDPRPDYEDKTADDILDLFDDEEDE
jgi:hypothetical protein